ncbi:MAG: hypothetical protein HDR88_14575 [Bacteroides sp.]|nr:hypothetical protein [Bacteroides sp.]
MRYLQKFLICSIFIFGGFNAYAQYATYRNIYELEAAEKAPTQDVECFLKTKKGWARITIKVKESGSTILVVGYKTKNKPSYATYGDPNPWRSCKVYATDVNLYEDGREAAEYFDYKASISGLGTIYF